MPRKKIRNYIIESIDKHDLSQLNSELEIPFSKYYTVEKYDTKQKDYRDKLKAKFSKKYDRTTDKARNVNQYYTGMKLNGIYRKRKISAFVDAAVQAAERFGAKYPGISVEDALISNLTLSTLYYVDDKDAENYITLGIALFILDSLVKSCNYEKAVYFIPRDEKINDIELPYNFQDSEFSNDVIKGVIYLIKNRLGSSDTYYSPESASITPEKKGFAEYNQYLYRNDDEIKDDDISSKYEYWEKSKEYYYDLAGKMTDSERYYALISFIRPEIIERSVQKFREKFFELIDIILEQASVSWEKCAKIADDARSVIEHVIRLNKEIKENEKNIRLSNQNRKNTKNVFSVLSSLDPINNKPDSKTNLMINGMVSRMTKHENLRKRTLSLANDLIEAENDMLYIIEWMAFDLSEDISGENQVECISDFRIQNPYEILFAFIYLIDSGDSLPWVSYISECLVGFATQHLPWHEKNLDYFDEQVMNKISDKTKDDKEESSINVEVYVEDDSDEYEDEYSLKYTDAYLYTRENLKLKKDELIPYNLAQIIYADSSVVPPRYKKDQYEPQQGFVKSGFTRKQAEIMQYYKGLADCIQEKYDFSIVAETEIRIREKRGEASVSEEPENLKEVITVRDKTIKALKKELHDAKKLNFELEDKISKMKDQYDSENQELIELRELIYKIQNDQQGEQDTETSNISFPYRTQARVVVFGGHETWLKVIVKLLPNVRFINPYDDPDANAIRNADVVWLQTNAMPHNKYNKIMDIVRSRKIPVKYFAYASAEKSAVQLAEFDMGMNAVALF